MNILDEIDNARKAWMSAKTTLEDKERFLTLTELVKKAQKQCVYPEETVSGNPSSVIGMVRGYGAYWNEWRGHLECPHCKADLRNLASGPPFKREIGQVVNECCTHFICPDCSKRI